MIIVQDVTVVRAKLGVIGTNQTADQFSEQDERRPIAEALVRFRSNKSAFVPVDRSDALA